MSFSEKVAIVTGGAEGIGRSVATAFAKEGARVAVADINKEQGTVTVDQIVKSGGKAIFVRTDVSDSSQVRNMVAETLQAFGRIDALCNNSGIVIYGDAAEMTEEDWDRVIGVNLKGTFLCSKYCIPEMLKVGGGSIVNIASVQALGSQARVAAYSASKGGIISLTHSIAVDFSAENIRVNAICPGTIDTPMVRRAAALEPDPDAAIRGWGKAHPIGRVGKPEEIAQAVLFLASEGASFITGAALVVDGGVMARLPI